MLGSRLGRSLLAFLVQDRKGFRPFVIPCVLGVLAQVVAPLRFEVLR
jgi:hypothetical protein